MFSTTTTGMLEVDGGRAAAAIERVVRGIDGDAQAGIHHAVDTQHLGAQVGEQHGAERRRADASDLDDRVATIVRTWLEAMAKPPET